MAWPPPPLPINRTNSTPQETTHPGDHNTMSQAINDTVAYFQSAAGQVSSSLAGNIAYDGALLILTRSQTITTNGFGDGDISLTTGLPSGRAFAASPLLSLVLGDANANAGFTLALVPGFLSVTGFRVRVFNPTGAPFGGAVRVDFIAIGRMQ